MPPAATARGTPAGRKLVDGFSTKITFAGNSTLSVWEKTVQPPGMDSGDPIDTSTMHNTRWRTMAGRALVTLTEHTFTCAYDPVVYTSVLALLGVNTTVTCRFPDGSTLAYFGILRQFEGDQLTEGEFPTATVTITPTNTDPTTGAEAAPVLVEVAGT